MKRHRSAIATMFCLLFGPIVWATHLMTIYAAHALLCARGAGMNAPASVVAVATILALILMAGAVRMATRTTDAFGPAEEQSFHRRVMLWLTALSALAVLWAGAASAVIPACTPLR